MLFFGLDGEMSAADVSSGGRLIQIGLAVHTNRKGEENDTPPSFGSLINPGPCEWNERAAVVHGFTREEIERAPSAETVDSLCIEWLTKHGLNRARSGIAVGFNVGSFDLPHLSTVLPGTALLFSRRTVDLNAICFTLEGKRHEGGTPTWSGWKRMASTYAQRAIAERGLSIDMAHDAEYDALLHLFAWRFLKAAAQGSPIKISQEPVRGLGWEAQRLTGQLLSSVGIEEAIQITGFTREQLQGWANGGRVRGPEIVDRLRSAIPALP